MGKSFGTLLRAMRRSKGMSQRELAGRVGVDFSYISKVENDRLAAPSADTIQRICRELEVSPDELLAHSGKVPSNLKDMVSGSAAALNFLREAHSMALTDDDWAKLSGRLKRLRKE
jgi:HTH-type transcriptional regulator, competence development regulator